MPRTGRGRGWFSKRWIYWKRRYSNPTMRDWFLLICLIWIVVAAGLALVNFRLAAIVLGACPVMIGLLRLVPNKYTRAWSNRSRGYDALVSLCAGVALIVLALSVPGV